MPDELPKRLDVSSLAGRAVSLDTEFAVSECKRLVEALAGDSGSVKARISLYDDEAGRSIIAGRASADVRVLCQRCMAPFTTELDTEFRLALVADDTMADALPDSLEPLLAADGTVDPRTMIEDELILALPVVAKHGEGEACALPGVRAVQQDDARPRPFAVLESLKTDQEH